MITHFDTPENMTPLNSLDFAKKPEDTRIVVAMSGGVDSSVVAAILKREGYDVLGITLQLYDHGEAIRRAGSCCAGQDIDDARRVCETLGIPHYVLDYERNFRDQVINPFMDAYLAGETPVPCITCNQTVKFADLLATARDLGADALATGHYIASRPNGGHNAHRALYRPVDAERDQSYFLFATTQDQLDYVRFPLGKLPKSEVRQIAEDMGLIVAQKKDSQDICFVPQGKYSDVIAKLRPNAALAGPILHIDGTLLGHHDGIVNYTIGQRRGIGIAAAEPLYVIALDARSAAVIVGPRDALGITTLTLRDVNWLGDAPLGDDPALAAKEGMAVYARVRSTRPPKPAHVFLRDGVMQVELDDGEDGVSPGQACVLYSDETGESRIFGGGFIQTTARDAAFETKLENVIALARAQEAETTQKAANA